jgi:hypothetical protein
VFVLDSFLGWVLNAVARAAEAEMNDDSALRERLLEAELRRDAGEISDDEFTAIESRLLSRIRDLRDRNRESSSVVLGNGEPIEISAGARLRVEASVLEDVKAPDAVPRVRSLDRASRRSSRATQAGRHGTDSAARAAGRPARGRRARSTLGEP